MSPNLSFATNFIIFFYKSYKLMARNNNYFVIAGETIISNADAVCNVGGNIRWIIQRLQYFEFPRKRVQYIR
jgi:hypothetical protein